MTINEIQEEINKLHETGEHVGSLNDTYHSFDELYDHRCILTAALFRNIPFTWKSKIHEDGSMFDGMFIVGVTTPDGDATYHYDLPYWDLFRIPELPHAPLFDGHTPEIALERIKKYFAREILQYNDEEMKRLVIKLDRVLNCFGDDEDAKKMYLDTFLKRKQ